MKDEPVGDYAGLKNGLSFWNNETSSEDEDQKNLDEFIEKYCGNDSHCPTDTNELEPLIHFCKENLNSWGVRLPYAKAKASLEVCLKVLENPDPGTSTEQKILNFLQQIEKEKNNFSSFPEGKTFFEAIKYFFATLFQKNRAQVFSRKVQAQANEILKEMDDDPNCSIRF